MNFVHDREYLNQGDVVIVHCSHQSNVRLTDDNNFGRLRSGQEFSGYGGGFKRFPARIVVPSTGYWNTTIDLGGGSAVIQHKISYIKRQ